MTVAGGRTIGRLRGATSRSRLCVASRIARYRRSPAIAAASIALLVAVSAVAVASIPGSGSVVNACYQKNGGGLRVIDAAKRGRAGKCRSGEKALSWNEQGPKGSQGIAGTPGTPGTQGTAGAPGSPGPAGAALGWAHVLGDGTVNSGHNVTTANVTHPFTTGYCFTGLGFVPHAVVASLDGFNFTAGSTDAAQVKIGDGFSPGQCPAGVQVEVHVQIASGTPEPFSIIFE
jgi:hypothetical protein